MPRPRVSGGIGLTLATYTAYEPRPLLLQRAVARMGRFLGFSA